MWVFEVERWFSLRQSTECIEHVVYIAALEYDWRRVAKEYSYVGIREKHLWASVFMCHPRSPITRCQRLGVILCAILSLMLSSLMFYELKHTDEEEFEKYELKLREILIAIQSGIIQAALTISVHYCFQ
ncbi:Hypothetical protein CINCED_3A004184 [Cinara cedri]|uniref:Uncharacterized protein n=1 Tax=Cinara cedri TaxID=506608 RepID=A0A5E4MW98_9HEMI|nr:Hypothetical protein CINCED_3A004184 [Cinara cedri]